MESLLEREFVTIKESETSPTDLWFEWQARRISAEKNVALDDALRARVRRELRPPAHLDFRIAKDA